MGVLLRGHMVCLFKCNKSHLDPGLIKNTAAVIMGISAAASLKAQKCVWMCDCIRTVWHAKKYDKCLDISSLAPLSQNAELSRTGQASPNTFWDTGGGKGGGGELTGTRRAGQKTAGKNETRESERLREKPPV